MGAGLRLLSRSRWASPPADVNYSNQRRPLGGCGWGCWVCSFRLRRDRRRGWRRTPGQGRPASEPCPGSQETVGAVRSHPPTGQAAPPTPARPRDCQKLECPWGYGEGRGFRVSARAEQEATCDPTRAARDASWRWGQARARGCRNAFLSQPPTHWIDGWRPGSRRAPRTAGGRPTVAHVAGAGGRRGNLGTGPDLCSHLPGLRGARRPAPVRRSVLRRRGVPLCDVRSRSRSSARPRPEPRPRAHSWRGWVPPAGGRRAPPGRGEFPLWQR